MKPPKAGVGGIRYSLEGWGERVGNVGEKKPKDDSRLRAYIGVMAQWPGWAWVRLYEKPDSTFELPIPAGTAGVLKFFGELEYALEFAEDRDFRGVTYYRQPKWE